MTELLPRIAAAAGPVLLILAFTYALITIVAFVMVDRIMFQPPPPSYVAGGAAVTLTTEDGALIAAVFLANDTARHVILHSHGNAEDLGHVLPLLQRIRELGFDVLGYDYRGYGASEGRPSARAAARDIEAAYAYLTGERGIAPERIILYGRSIGSGPSLELAARRPVGGVILESPFTSAYRVLTRYPILPFDRFRNLSRIRELDRPVLVLHGTADNIVAPWHGRRLYEAAQGPKRALWVDGAGHQDVPYARPELWAEAVRSFASDLVGCDDC